jgi:hypothetical protein
MSFKELIAEYRSVGIGPRLLREIHDVVKAVVRGYDPVVYGHVASWDLGLDDLVQEFGLDVLVGQGQLDYAMLVASDRTHFRRLMARQLRYLLARRRRRTVVDNLLDRSRRRVARRPFQLVKGRSEWSYTLEDKEVRPGRVGEDLMRKVAAELADIPTNRCAPRVRAPVLYSEQSLGEMLERIASSVECAVAVSDLDRIFNVMLTSWVPSFLKDGEGAVARAEAQGLDAEELMIAAEVTNGILAMCGDGSRELLRLKLDGRSDREIARRLGLSRPTVAKRKRALMLQLERSLDGLHDGLRQAVLDRVGAELGPFERDRHGPL